MTESGLFITFEGPEGSGKTTQMRILVERLRAEGYAVTENQEPGATAIGSQIRRILLDPAITEMAPMTERSFYLPSSAARLLSATAGPTRPSPIKARHADSALKLS